MTERHKAKQQGQKAFSSFFANGKYFERILNDAKFIEATKHLAKSQEELAKADQLYEKICAHQTALQNNLANYSSYKQSLLDLVQQMESMPAKESRHYADVLINVFKETLAEMKKTCIEMSTGTEQTSHLACFKALLSMHLPLSDKRTLLNFELESTDLNLEFIKSRLLEQDQRVLACQDELAKLQIAQETINTELQTAPQAHR